MQLEEFKNLVIKTRCCRRFKKIDIKSEDLIKIVQIAALSSSAKNLQPLKYIIVSQDKKIKQKIFKPLKWAAALKDWQGPIEEEKPSAYIIVLCDKNISDYCMVDAGIAMQTIMLSLTSIDLSGCILASIDKNEYKKIFDLPENIEPIFAIAIGKRGEEIKIVPKKDSIEYFRDEKNAHCVPKRSLNEVLWKIL